MLYDKDIRDELCDYMEDKFGKVRFFEELVLDKSRADIVIVTSDALVGVEIKSDADTYARLPKQVRNYDRFCDMNYIVVGSKHGESVFEHVPEHWGVITVEEIDAHPDFYERRAASRSPKVRLTNQMGLLWRSELAHIQANNKLYKYPGKSKMYVKKYLMNTLDRAELYKQMLEELFERDYSIYDDA